MVEFYKGNFKIPKKCLINYNAEASHIKISKIFALFTLISGIHQESKTGETGVEENLIYYEETHKTLASWKVWNENIYKLLDYHSPQKNCIQFKVQTKENSFDMAANAGKR